MEPLIIRNFSNIAQNTENKLLFIHKINDIQKKMFAKTGKVHYNMFIFIGNVSNEDKHIIMHLSGFCKHFFLDIINFVNK